MHCTGVSGFVVMSDGIDRDLQPRLAKILGMRFDTLSDLRETLLRNASVTWDDKSLIFGHFRGE